MENLILKSISVNENIVEYEFTVTSGLERFFKSRTLFCRYNVDLTNVPDSILAIPFVGSIAGLCWLENFALWVPEIDRSYYDGLRNVKWAYAEMYQDHPMKGRLIPAKLVENTFQSDDKAILLFGGGVDAHTTFIRHFEEISDLINIQGWFESKGAPKNKAAEDDFSHCADVAKANGKNFIKVESNFAQIINIALVDKLHSKRLHDAWWHGIQHSMAFISLGIPVAYKKRHSTIFIGSSQTIGDKNICASCITTDSEYRYSSVGKVVHDGFELSRQDKVRVITDFQRTTNKPYPLKVCSFNDHNCCECEKCFRTILEIVAEGADPRLFGFQIQTGLKEHFLRVIRDKLALWGVAFEWETYWKTSACRMRENYENILEKDFADWFLDFDFLSEKRKALLQYYRHNFFPILKRKVFGK